MVCLLLFDALIFVPILFGNFATHSAASAGACVIFRSLTETQAIYTEVGVVSAC